MLELIDVSACLASLFLLSPVLVQATPSTSSAASGRSSRMSPPRGLVEGLVFPTPANSELLLSPHCDCYLFVLKSCSFLASLPCDHVETGVIDLQDAVLLLLRHITSPPGTGSRR